MNDEGESFALFTERESQKFCDLRFAGTRVGIHRIADRASTGKIRLWFAVDDKGCFAAVAERPSNGIHYLVCPAMFLR